jgi:hypothetical protein
MPAEIWASYQEVCVLRRAEEDPRTSVQRTAPVRSISVLLSEEFSICNNFTHTTSRKCKHSPLSPPDHLARLFAKWVVNTQFVANILCSDKAEFTRDGIVNFHNTHAWVDDNPHITVASRQN